MQNPQDPNARDQFRSLALVGQLGFASGLPVILCALAGYYLERRYPMKGFLVIGGVLLGVASGMVAAYRILAPFLYQGNDDTKR